MPYNGNGVFATKYTWVSDLNEGLPISPKKWDIQEDDIADGLTASLTKDGSTEPVSNLPMATYRHTGVSAAQASDEYVTASQIQDSGTLYAETSGTSVAYTATLSPALESYEYGGTLTQTFYLKFHTANGTNPTLNINGLGSLPIYTNQGISAVKIPPGTIASGQIVKLIYSLLAPAAAFRVIS